MDLNYRVESDIAIVNLEGRLDWNALSSFSGSISQLVDTGVKKVLLDFSKTEYMSSAGVRALIEVSQNLEAKKGQLAICSPNDNLQELFEVIQMDKIIKIYKTEFDALDKMMG